MGERVSIFHIITRKRLAVISPSGCICLGGAGVVDLNIFVGAGARVSKQVRADGNCARVVAVTSEIDKVTNKSGKNVQLEYLLPHS